jgi:outer membrane receptor protein involved in Fe transport
VYGEVKLPLLAGLPLIQKLGLNGAFRLSDYDRNGIGGVWTYLGGVEWRVDDGIAFRGQYQRAVRAPNVGELFGGLRQSSEAAVDPCSSRQPAASRTAAVRTLCVAGGVPADLVFTQAVQPDNLVTATYGGNPDVGVESSDTYTLGTVITPPAMPRLSLSVDYFDITLDGAIAPLGGGLNNTLKLCYNVIQDDDSPFCKAISRNPVTGQISGQYTAKILQANTGALKTSGIDIGLRYSLDLRFGFPGLGSGSTIDLSSNWTWTHEFTSTPVAAFPNIKNRCVGAFGTTCGEPIPAFRGVTRITWRTGPLDLSIRARFVDAVTVDTYLLPKRSGSATTPDIANQSPHQGAAIFRHRLGL